MLLPGLQNSEKVENMPAISMRNLTFALPEELLAKVLSLSTGRRVARAACVCRSWSKVVEEKDEIWKEVLLYEFGLHTSKPNSMSWKQAYLCEWRWRFGKLSAETIKVTQKCISFCCFLPIGAWLCKS